MNNNADTALEFEHQVSSVSITDHVTPSMSRNCLTDDYTHYESQAFSVQLAVNPLVSAASPLLHLAAQLRTQYQKPNIEHLYQALCHEVHTFEYRAHASNYPPQVILGARYQVCALLDEIIAHTAWGRKIWQQKSLLQTFQQETWGGERFFTILERCSQNPGNYIDLLELGYLCLSLGFKGKYNQPEGSLRLERLIDNLFKLIRRQRGDVTRYLTMDTGSDVAPKSKYFWRLPPLWLSLLLTMIIATSIYVPYHRHLQRLSQPIDQMLMSKFDHTPWIDPQKNGQSNE